MPQVQLIARHTITPGRENEVFTLLSEFIDAARAEPGNLGVDAYRKVGDRWSYVLLERYASREALAEHRSAAHYIRLLHVQIMPLLDCRALEEFDVPE
jgi:quinol monooxygenase YgiN